MPRAKTPKEPKIPPPPERDVQSAVLDLLTLRGIPHFRSNAGGGYRIGRGGKPQLIKGAPAGHPDIYGWLPVGYGKYAGAVLGLEIKRVGERPTEAQLAVLRCMLDAGGVGVWVNDAVQVDRILDALRAGRRVEMNQNGDQYLTSEP